jgi:hypothetical protein
MKVEKITTKPVKKFEPVTIQITFENSDELWEFYNLFNYSGIIDAVPNVNHEAIRSALGTVKDLACGRSWSIFIDTIKSKVNR